MLDQYKANTYYLVRHGEAENNVRDILNGAGRGEYHLTVKGQGQARETALYLKQFPIDFIITSPLARAKETAAILQESLEVPRSIDTRLTETRFGSFEGKDIQSFLDFMEQHGGRTVGDPDQGIEGYMDIRERVRSLLLDVQSVFQRKHIVIVSHLDTLQELYAELLGEPVGAEQGDSGWYPQKGSCAVINAVEVTQFFAPTV